MNLTSNKIVSIIQKKLRKLKFKSEKHKSFGDNINVENKRVILRSDFNVSYIQE